MGQPFVLELYRETRPPTPQPPRVLFRLKCAGLQERSTSTCQFLQPGPGGVRLPGQLEGDHPSHPHPPS